MGLRYELTPLQNRSSPCILRALATMLEQEKIRRDDRLSLLSLDSYY